MPLFYNNIHTIKLTNFIKFHTFILLIFVFLSTTQFGETRGFSGIVPKEDNYEFVIISDNCGYDFRVFKSIGNTVLKALDFYEKNVNNLVLDAAIGTRMLEAQIGMALKLHPNLPPKIKEYLIKLHRKTAILTERIITQMKDMTPKQRAETLPWVNNASIAIWEMPDGKWKSENILKSYEDMPAILDFSKETLTESVSDECIAQIFNECRITSTCAEIFLKEPHSMYSLTHQTIFMLLAQINGCIYNKNFLKFFYKGDWEKYLENLCGKVYSEANLIARVNFQPSYRDLFTEQVAICSLGGYPNFLNKTDWLDNILSWQSETYGCFPIQIDGKRKRSDEKLLKRTKRSESTIKVGDETCSVHFTSVALSALSIHMRYFMDTCLSNY